jgi:hypothetical protein
MEQSSIFVLKCERKFYHPRIVGYFLSLADARKTGWEYLKGIEIKEGEHQPTHAEVIVIEHGVGLFSDHHKVWPLKPELIHECPCGQGQCYVYDDGTSGCDF